MRPVDLFKSTPFRLALTFSGLFFALFVIAATLTVRQLSDHLSARLDESVAEAVSVLKSAYQPDDVEDLISSVDTYASAVAHGDSILFLSDSAGMRIAGNVSKADVPLNWGRVSASSLGLGVGAQYRTFAMRFGAFLLVVGMSFENTDAITGIAIWSFLWSGFGAMALAIALGALLAAQARRRISAVAASMERVGEGDLSARLPVSRSGDDIDRLSAQINGALARLGASVASMKQVSTDIAHDLRTPLNRIALTIDSALKKAAAGGDVATELEQARDDCFRVNQTFDALLRIAQIEAGARRSRFAQIDLRAALESVGDAYAAVAEDSGHKFSFLVPDDFSLPVFGDRDLLVQLLANLIENAIRHCPPGSSIRLAAERRGGTIEVAVSDDGPGIPADEHEQVFRRLYRVDKARSSEGAGLGLSLVKAIAELHGGTVSLRDNNPGLKVVVELPTTTQARTP